MDLDADDHAPSKTADGSPLDLDAITLDGEALRRSAWLSRGLEVLIESLGRRRAALVSSPHPHDRFDFDVVIVGSGYGGAVALSELAGCTRDDGAPLRIAMLERGQEYLPGAFPNGFAELAGHVRVSMAGAAMPVGKPLGVFDVRVGADVQSLVGNGVGGGSLINAGVMAMPHRAVFADARWPKAIRADVGSVLDREQALLAALNVSTHPGNPKGKAMRALAGMRTCVDAQVQVTPRGADRPVNAQGVEMSGCIGCGDCFSGCNHGAKASLDVTLLVPACRMPGVELFTGANVLRLAAADGGWTLEVVHTDPRRRVREPAPLDLRARRVVLAAGTFGSTEILLRSRRATAAGPGLALSPLVGERFSGNGDSMTAVYGIQPVANSLAREERAPGARDIGPTITSIIDLRGEDGQGVDELEADNCMRRQEPVVLEELTAPAAMRVAYEQIVLTADALRRLGEPDSTTYPESRYYDANAVDDAMMDRSLLLAVIGHDDANGRLVLSDPADGDGTVSVDWPLLREDPRLKARERRIAKMAGALGGVALANPAWRALPSKLDGMLGAPLGPTLTVHPLGGCAMGEDGRTGVVDDLGRVFAGVGSDLHDGLIVLDGAIVPTSLGINPALCIAALAQRAITRLRDDAWKFAPRVPADRTGEPSKRPRYREIPLHVVPRPTLVTVSERLECALAVPPGVQAYKRRLRLQLTSKPIELRKLMACRGDPGAEAGSAAVLTMHSDSFCVVEDEVDVSTGTAWTRIAKADVAGTLTAMNRLPSGPWERAFRSLPAWFLNRGMRDVVQSIATGKAKKRRDPADAAGADSKATLLFNLGTHAGGARLLDYDLTLTQQEHHEQGVALTGPLVGRKTLAYGRAANPWTQLQHVAVSRMPAALTEMRSLSVDMMFFREFDSLLMQVVDQQDTPTAVADFAAYGLYLLRTMLHLHLWSFRLPDAAPEYVPNRLPGAVHNAPVPEISRLVVDTLRDGTPVVAQLTRYRGGSGVPVLLIHGYSASGTTFAHPAIEEGGLAPYLARRGRDVWILDLRSSAGLPGARGAWTFEQVGYIDIPLAVERILQATGEAKLDVVAHCMGSAMLLMALLGHYPDEPQRDLDPQLELRRALPGRINKLVMSQVGPRLRMAPTNLLRAQAMRYLQYFLPLDAYTFRPEGPRGAGEDMLDRLLGSVPYNATEFTIENPLWPPWRRLAWVGTRHRIDALYGVTFDLRNMPEAVLERLDDFFGPLNVRTATQVMHFTAAARITDSHGEDKYTDLENASGRMTFPCMSLHSRHNGLVDFHTCKLMDEFFRRDEMDGKLYGSAVPLEAGHQDALIGTNAPTTFEKIWGFLQT